MHSRNCPGGKRKSPPNGKKSTVRRNSSTRSGRRTRRPAGNGPAVSRAPRERKHPFQRPRGLGPRAPPAGQYHPRHPPPPRQPYTMARTLLRSLNLNHCLACPVRSTMRLMKYLSYVSRL
uniref:Uncharacterized protein n=1 Tax=Cacopsylla melanoneura TaxID=428564 RepID=A0A8D8W4E0_9HEMI